MKWHVSICLLVLAGCTSETVYLSRFWGFCLLGGIASLLFLTWLVNLKDTAIAKKYLIWTGMVSLAAALCFPGWAMKSPGLATMLARVQSLKSLIALSNQGASRNTADQQLDKVVVDCRDKKKKSGITSSTQLKDAPDLSACLRKLANEKWRFQKGNRSQKGLVQARRLLNAAETTIKTVQSQRRPMTAAETKQTQQQIKAAESLIKGDRKALKKSEQDRLIKRLFDTL